MRVSGVEPEPSVRKTEMLAVTPYTPTSAELLFSNNKVKINMKKNEAEKMGVKKKKKKKNITRAILII